jgi:PHD/YefM family antitoxin component YafN of YafNO toxin-antitoxin module
MLMSPMLDLNDIHPVTDFNRNTKEHIQRLKQTGKPEVLTVNGQAEIVVQSAQAYQKLLESAELSETLAGIRRGLDQVKRGEGRPMRQFLEKLAEKHGVSLT